MNFEQLFEQKGIVGSGLSFLEKSVRFASVKQEGALFRVLDLKEVSCPDKSQIGMIQALRPLELEVKTALAANYEDKNLVVKKMLIPPVGKNEIIEAIKFQMMDDSSGSAENQEGFDVRYEKLGEQNEEGMDSYLVYGSSAAQIDSARNFYSDLDLNVLAVEPVAVTLASMVDFLEPDPSKVRGIFYKEEKKFVFAGMKGSQLHFSKTLASPHPEDEGHADWMVEFQQAVDEFLMQEKISQLDQALLAGTWEAEEKEKISANLGVTCSFLGEKTNSLLVFENEEIKKKWNQFLLPIALAMFPKDLT